MILKHRDTEVLRFDWVQPFGVKNVEVNPAAERFLPLAFRDRVRRDPTRLRYEFEMWLLSRTPPLRRAGIRDMLHHLGYDDAQPSWARDLITFSRGLSLNDVHWIVTDDSAETWAAANLYENPFSTAVAAMAFTGEKRTSVRDASTSPEYSTNGNLRKCWRRVDGEILLYKGSGSDTGSLLAHRNAAGYEPFSEYYAAQVAAAMKLPHVPYGLAQFKHRLCSTCPLFTSDKTGYLPALHVMNRDAARQDVRFADIHLFDAVIFNNDRHLGNFGFLVDNDVNELAGPAPIFDNGYGLFAKAISEPTRDNEFNDLRRYLARTGPKLLENWLAIPGGVTDEMIDRLKGMENFEFKPHPDFTMPDNRLELSQYFLRNRIDKIIRYREKADSFLNVRRKDVIINPTLGGRQLKRAKATDNLRRELKETLKSFPKAKTEKLAILFKTTTRTIARHIKALQDAGELRRVGSRKSGFWQVIETKLLALLLSLSPALLVAAAYGATIYDGKLYSQIELDHLNDSNREQYLADVRAAGIDTLLLSYCDHYEIGERRLPLLKKVAAETERFHRAGLPVMLWINGFGYGDSRTSTPDGKQRFGKSQNLVSLDGRTNGAICPLDPAIRAFLRELVRDGAKSGVDGILMDDDYVQSARGFLGCACPLHLARLSRKLGRAVTREEVLASFAGSPNALRTAFVDMTGEVAIELARELRAEVDVVNPSLGMGLCLSYTHWDVEGAPMEELLAAFAGRNGRKIVRLSGAPYWSDSKFNGAGLEGVIEFVRTQAEWTRGRGWTVFDENDPYPRKVAQVPAWRCELYDKATIADGISARHKYILVYGPDRAEPGYLEAHLANMSDDVLLRELFAGTEPYGVYVPFARRRIRELTLPAMGERELSELVSQPLAADLLVRSGIPVRHDSDAGSYTLDETKFGVDLFTLDFAKCRGEDYRPAILAAAREAGKPVGVYVKTSAPRVYQLVRRDPKTGVYALLLENFGDGEASVEVVTPGRPVLRQTIRAAFVPGENGMHVRVPAHSWLAASFGVKK